MTASLFVTGTPAWSDLGLDGVVVHAVAKPTLDGLESSVCGVLVTASTARDWLFPQDAVRCGECARIAG